MPGQGKREVGVRIKFNTVKGVLEDKKVVLIDDSIAVSYTHLRAHETVLDLVCRLLLEKKKNNI